MPEQARQALHALIDGGARWPLLMFGRSGSGKTCSALCLLDYTWGTYWTVPEFVELLIRADQGRLVRQGSNGCDYACGRDWVWEKIDYSMVAVLDEIGARNIVSDHHYECVKRFCDLREERPTVYISNLTPHDLGRIYDDRIVSRLCSGTVLEMDGRDQRLQGSLDL